MRSKLPLLALCLCALGVMLGQNDSALVGMPESGVTLAGTPSKPEIVNNSGRGILGYVIWHRDANGHGPVMPILKTTEMRLTLVRPASAPAPPQSNSISTFSNGGPIYTFSNGGVTGGNIIQAVLQAVIFGDGQFVGSDRFQYFDNISARIDGERALAQSVSGKKISWDELQALFTQWRNERPPQGSIEESVRHAAQVILAGQLLSIRRAYGEAAALAMADWTAKLPVLWKAK